MARGARAAELSWVEVEARLAGGSVAVLPIGAAAKEHGPHLPLSTDWLTAEALGRALAEREDVLVFPSLGYGFYPAFVAYPGSTSVPEAAFEETCRALVADLARAGARSILVVNTGISTIRPLERALEGRAVAAHVYRGPRYLAALASIAEQPRGGHADEAETSVMLHLHPELVRMDRAPSWTREVRPGRWSKDDPESASYSPSGVFGDATLATAEKGARLFAAMIEDLSDALRR
jgi:creatinine amidohydrolase